jgi:SAM-dependent methyltransferase
VSRFNAWFFDTFDGLLDASLSPLKRQVYVDLPGAIVEIGPGAGANFRYYPPGATVVAIEPNVAMHERLTRNARRAGVDLVIRTATAEDTGLGDASVSVVVSSLVLCTVADPRAAVAEAHRILEPGGRLLFVEHVRDRAPLLRWFQRLARRPWRWIFEGCELDRDTASTIRDGGFSRVDIGLRRTLTMLAANPCAYGLAIK